MTNKLFSISTLALTLLCVLPNVHAVERQSKATPTFENVEPAANFFQAIDAGFIDVKFIAPNAQQANVLIQNKTDHVLHVKLPNAFAAVPVLAQFDRGGQNFGQGIGGPGMGGPGGGGASQGVGGGFQQQGFGQGQQGMGMGMGQGRQGMQFGGMMRIAPEKVRKLKATTVCLEHGKPEPNARIKYQIIPIDRFTKDKRVAELCEKLGRGEIKQNTAQAIAWHLANKKSWLQLAKINRIESRYLGNTPFFTSAELKQAQKVTGKLGKTAPIKTESSTK